MSLFSKYRPTGYQYKIPERITTSEARERRLTALLDREKRFQQVPNFSSKLKEIQAERSRVPNLKKNVNDEKAYRQKAATLAAAASKYKEADFSDPQKRESYRALRRAQNLHEVQWREAEKLRLRGEGQRKVNTTGLNHKMFNPTGQSYANTRSGTAARLSSALINHFVPSFKSPWLVIPCIERHGQREVMFAKGYGGKGYHTKKRRTWSSGIPC